MAPQNERDKSLAESVSGRLRAFGKPGAQAAPSPAHIIFIVFLLLLTLWAWSYFAANQRQAPSAVVPVGSESDYAQAAAPQAGATPSSATADELYSVFLSARRAIYQRDYPAFYNLSSSSVRAYLDNTDNMTIDPSLVVTNLTAFGYSGEIVPAPTDYSFSTAFSQSAPWDILIYAPGAEFVVPVRAAGISNRTARLYLRTLDGYPYSANGSARFDYENGSWKYSRESWVFQRKSPGYGFGSAEGAAATHAVTRNSSVSLSVSPAVAAASGAPRTHEELVRESRVAQEAQAAALRADPDFQKRLKSAYYPRVLNITRGDAVTWANVSGRVITVKSASAPWNSEYLYNGNYTRVFDAPGEYFYKISGDEFPPAQAFVGAIMVN